MRHWNSDLIITELMITDLIISDLIITDLIITDWMLTQQWRLIPYLAATYALDYFAKTFYSNFIELQMGMMMKDSSERQVSV